MNNEVARVLRRYYQYLKLEKSFSPNTIDAYQRDLDKFLIFLKDEGVDYCDATLQHMHLFSSLMIDIGIGPTSLSRILSGVRSFYHFLLLEDIIETDPTELLQFPKKARRLPDVLTADEVDRIESVINLADDEGHRDRAIIEVLFSCGLRVSELCNLKMSDLFLDEGFIRVEGKGSKQRLVPISQTAIHELNLYFADRCHITPKQGHADFVFLSYRRRTGLSRITIFHLIKTLVERAGIQKVVSPHTFRHSFATCLLEGGANLRAIQAMLGHESISTTEIYMHIDMTHLREEILEHHPRNKS